MTLAEPDPPPPPSSASSGEAGAWLTPGRQNVILIYGLYLLGLVFGLTIVIGVVMAYVNRGRAEPWVDCHYRFLIRTFWIGLAYSFLAALLIVAVIGGFLFIAIAIWFVIRLVKGVQAASQGRALERVETWGIP